MTVTGTLSQLGLTARHLNPWQAGKTIGGAFGATFSGCPGKLDYGRHHHNFQELSAAIVRLCSSVLPLAAVLGLLILVKPSQEKAINPG